jgi:SAM-dependent methyltransferase
MARTHDVFYLKENRYREPKENFKFCLNLARQWKFDERGVVCDVGCAAGEFPYYLKQQLPEADIVGVEYLPSLIAKAEQEVPGVQFRQGSVLDPNALPRVSADLSFLVGVHSLFDDPIPAFENLVNWTKPGGQVIVFSLFNRFPIDVYIKVRRQSDPADHREEGWNMISQATVSEFLKDHPRVAEHRFVKFNIDLDLAQRVDDPLRTWTFKDEQGVRHIINGIGLVHDFHALQIRVR